MTGGASIYVQIGVGAIAAGVQRFGTDSYEISFEGREGYSSLGQYAMEIALGGIGAGIGGVAAKYGGQIFKAAGNKIKSWAKEGAEIVKEGLGALKKGAGKAVHSIDEVFAKIFPNLDDGFSRLATANGADFPLNQADDIFARETRMFNEAFDDAPMSGQSKSEPWRDYFGEGAESDAMNAVGKREAGMAEKPRHHVFPQEYRSFFEKRGFVGAKDIDNFALELDEATHQAIHGGGDWRLARKVWDGEWNTQIIKRLTNREKILGRKLDFNEVFEIGEQMIDDYGLDKLFVPYKR
jgi:hypothetical protein